MTFVVWLFWFVYDSVADLCGIQRELIPCTGSKKCRDRKELEMYLFLKKEIPT